MKTLFHAKMCCSFRRPIQIRRVCKLGDSLERLDKAIEWRLFRRLLKKQLQVEVIVLAGRPPFGHVLMFRVLILQEYFGLSDEQMKFSSLFCFPTNLFLN